MSGLEFDRRLFLRALGAAGLVGGGALVSCGSDTEPEDTAGSPSAPLSGDSRSSAGHPSSATGSTSTASGATAHLPTFKARAGLPAPTAAGDQDGLVPAVYDAYPKDPVVLPRSELNGDGVTAATAVLRVPPPLEKNPFWQELNKRLGVGIDIQFVPSAQYSAKLATLVASGDMPDVLPVWPSVSPRFIDLLESEFEDLTEHLAGEAILDYPNLAALPTAAWEAVSVNGHIYNLPVAVPAVSTIPAVRLDIFEKLSLTTEPADGKEFMEICSALTDEKKSRWAFASISEVGHLIHDMADVPNQWRVEDGRFTSQYATDEYKDYLVSCAVNSL